MLYYPISALVNAIASTIVGLLAISKNPRSPLNRSFSYFAFSVAFWAYCYFFWQIAQDTKSALFWCRVLMAGAIFIPSTFFHFSMTFVHQQKKYFKQIVLWYTASAVFLLTDFTPLFIPDVRPRLGFPYWPSAGLAYTPFLAMFIGLTYYTHVLMFRSYKKSTGFEKNRIKYVFLGTAIGFIGGSTNYLLWYDIPVPPFGNALVAIYVLMVAYATVRYRLMDITLFTVRGLIFSIVYCLVLGVPFWIGFKFLGGGWWVVPVGMMAILATAGPFIYNYVRNKAESVVLKEQRQYQDTILKLSQGMALVVEMNKLLELIVQEITNIGIKNASIFLMDKESAMYVFKFSRHKDDRLLVKFNDEEPIIKWLKEKKSFLIYEEIKSALRHNGVNEEPFLHGVEAQMKEMNTALLVPCFVQKTLLGFLALGEKINGRMYTQDDLNVFGVLANQSALAIENAKFYEERGKSLAEEFQENKLKHLGNMASSICHDVNNHFTGITLEAWELIDSVIPKLRKNLNSHLHLKENEEIIALVEKKVNLMHHHALGGGQYAEKIRRRARKGIAMESLNILEVIEFSKSLVRYPKESENDVGKRIPMEQIGLEVQIPADFPKILSDGFTLERTFANFLNNAYDAQAQKIEEIKLGNIKIQNYVPKVVISATVMNGSAFVTVKDNGIGMTKDQLNQVFAPSFTTKVKTGTGLGLYNIKQDLDAIGVKISVESELHEWAAFTITLPIANQGGN